MHIFHQDDGFVIPFLLEVLSSGRHILFIGEKTRKNNDLHIPSASNLFPLSYLEGERLHFSPYFLS